VEDCVGKLIKIYRLTGRQDKLQELLHHRKSPQKGSPKRLIRPAAAEDVIVVEASSSESCHANTVYSATEILSKPFTADKKGWSKSYRLALLAVITVGSPILGDSSWGGSPETHLRS
jgi:hypothetical protein